MKIFLPLILLSVYSFLNLLGINSSLAKTHLLFIILGFFLFFFLKKINPSFFFTNIKIFFWFFIGILILTYIIGLEVKGSKRWLDFYFFRFQPSEFLKIFFILYLSVFFSKTNESINMLSTFLKSIFYLFIPVFIILNQPDLANSLIYFFIYLVMALFTPPLRKYIFYLSTGLIILSPIFFNFLKPYQKNRITSFLNPQSHYQSSAYNIVQSTITIGSGGFFGRGLGYGTQTKLYFLPEKTTDFAFASLVEQFGFFSGVIVIFLYFFILYLLLKKIFSFSSYSQPINKEKLYFNIGLTAYIFIQVVINTGMNLGLLPVAGVALPIISYGGTAIMTFFFGLALAFNT